MKKIFTTIVTALFAMTTFAQQSQQYFRVEFTVPITGDKIPAGQSNTSVAATMKDKYTYCTLSTITSISRQVVTSSHAGQAMVSRARPVLWAFAALHPMFQRTPLSILITSVLPSTIHPPIRLPLKPIRIWWTR